jgi:adenosylcobinamide kinase/adenosylcobinamide-phosphate guanylyltransferase
LGGVRSGKSRFAEERASCLGGENVLYVATAVVSEEDPDLARRVAAHRDRRPAQWGLLELSGGGLRPILEVGWGHGAVLLDSLTLWVSARMNDGEGEGAIGELDRLLETARSVEVPIVLVSDEVGLGGVAVDSAVRDFADLLGALNQRAAALADEVHLCVAGIPVRIK